MRIKKMTALGLALMMTASLAACGSKDEKSAATGTPGAAVSATTAPKNFTLKFAIGAKGTEQDENKKLIELASQAGVKVDFMSIPGDGAEYDKKLTMSLMAGEETDILYLHSMIVSKYINSNIIAPMNTLAQANQYDPEKIFGKYLMKKGNDIFALPAFADIWITLYNKKVFDDAKVPYPKAEDWTWSKYAETAKKLTDASKGIYGSYMLDYDCYNYMVAKQKKVPEYKDC